MFGFCKDAVFPQLLVKILHICRDAGLYRAEIMVVKLLPLRRSCAEKRSSAVNEILALFIHFLVNKEIFLLGAYCGSNVGRFVISEYAQDTQSLSVETFHGTQKGSFLVQSFARIGTEGCRDAE